MKFYKIESLKLPVFSGETLTNFRPKEAVWQPICLLPYIQYDGLLGNPEIGLHENMSECGNPQLWKGTCRAL